jgi:Protein of unknown function (DUF1217)
MISTLTSYKLITRDLERSLERKAAEPQIASDTAYFQENITKVESIDEFLGDYRLYSYAMKAYGLEDMTYAKAYMRKVLEEGVSNEESFVNSLSDERFKEFATAFDFESYGSVTTIRTDVTEGVVEKYTRTALESDAGEENEGVRVALYFERMVSSVDSYYDILADEALTKFFQVTFGLPETMSSIDVDQQVKLLQKVFDLSALQDPEEVAHLTERFSVMYDLNENTETDPILNLFTNSSSSASIDMELVASLQNLKLGG